MAILVATTLALVNTALARFSDAYAQIDLLADIRHEIVATFVETPDQTAMIEAAVRGMVESLDDPYTVFLSPDEIDTFDQEPAPVRYFDPEAMALHAQATERYMEQYTSAPVEFSRLAG